MRPYIATRHLYDKIVYNVPYSTAMLDIVKKLKIKDFVVEKRKYKGSKEKLINYYMLPETWELIKQEIFRRKKVARNVQ